MSRVKIVTLAVLALTVVALGRHQFQQSGRALNTNFIPSAYAQGTPTPTPTATPTPSPSPTPTPGPITESCTPGFFKNHPQFITGCGISSSTTVSTLLGATSTVDSCVGNLTLLQALQASASSCGSGNLAQAELILVKQLIAAVANAGNSTPPACTAASTLVAQSNLAIAGGDKTTITSLGGLIEKNVNNDKIGTLCGPS